MTRKILSLFAVLFLFVQVVKSQSDLYDLIKASPQHRILSILIDLYGYEDDLRNSPIPLTLYAPTDDAFTRLGPYRIISILSNPEEEIGNLLGRHVVFGKFTAANLTNGMQLLTISSEVLNVSYGPGIYKVNGIDVVTADIPASNGILNVVNDFIPSASTGNTVADLITKSPDHQAIATILATSGLEDQLKGAGPFTVFAPSDAAMEALDPLFVQELLADQAGKLRSLLLYHITLGNYTSGSLVQNQKILMSNGQQVTITFDGDQMFVNEVPVVVKDIIADNGVIHSIDAVLLPQLEDNNTIIDIVAKSPEHSILFASIALNDLTEGFRSPGPYTLLAPTNAAFEALPPGVIEDILLSGQSSDVLLNHVIPGVASSNLLADGMLISTIGGAIVKVKIIGDDIYFDNAKVSVKDIVADNGLVHVIDAVLVPETGNTIYDVIVKSPNHRILQGLVNLIGRKDDLQSEFASLSLFAPTDAAFASLPQEIIDTILNSELEEVATILGYHVAPVPLSSDQLTDGLVFKSITGADLRVTRANNDIFINDSRIILADILASNGIVHVVESVITSPAVVGLKLLSQNVGKVFPNPATEVINYDFSSELDRNISLELLDSSGKLLNTFRQSASGQLSTSELQTGVYQLRAKDEKSILTKPFIVVR